MRNLIITLTFLFALCIGASAQYVAVLPATSSSGGSATFTYVQDNQYNNDTGGGNPVSVTLGSTPTAGNGVFCQYFTYNNGSLTAPTVTISDADSNSYTMEAPINNTNDTGNFTGFGYLTPVPATASPVITASFSTTSGGYAFIACVEIHRSSGSWTLDSYNLANTANGTSSSGGVITVPTCTVSGANDFLFSGVYSQNTFSAGSTVNPPWTQLTTGGTNSSVWSAYDLSATTNTTINMTSGGGSTVHYAAGCLAFK